MTDQIELPLVPQSPPVISLPGYDDAVILFDRDMFNELIVNLEIRDEDRTEMLETRWRIESNAKPPGAQEEEYPCPEPQIVGDGSLVRRTALKLQGTSFARGKCSRVDVIVSSSFKPCKPDAYDGWDITTQEDDDADVGRLSFWVWVYDAGSNPLVQPAAALELAVSCKALDYRPPSATATTTSAAGM